jgi:hypothetical protein
LLGEPTLRRVPCRVPHLPSASPAELSTLCGTRGCQLVLRTAGAFQTPGTSFTLAMYIYMCTESTSIKSFNDLRVKNPNLRLPSSPSISQVHWSPSTAPSPEYITISPPYSLASTRTCAANPSSYSSVSRILFLTQRLAHSCLYQITRTERKRIDTKQHQTVRGATIRAHGTLSTRNILRGAEIARMRVAFYHQAAALLSIAQSTSALYGADFTQYSSVAKRQVDCPVNYFSCEDQGPAFEGTCCQNGQRCALDGDNQAACCPVG